MDGATTALQEPGAKANGKAWASIAVVMLGAVMFGVDCANFGLTQGFPDFVETWCHGHFDVDVEPRADGTVPNCTVREEDFVEGQTDEGWKSNPGYTETFCMLSNVLITVGAATGVVILGPTLAESKGRRMCISVGSAMTFVGCLISAFFSFGNVSIFYISRYITGFGVGTTCYCLPMYNSEMSTAKIRGQTGSYFQLFTVLGQCVAIVIMWFLQNMYVGLLMPGAFGLLVSILVWTVPESPRWTQKKKGFQMGYDILRLVREGSDEDVQREAKEIQDAIDAEGSITKIGYLDVWRESNLTKRTLIGCWMQVAQQLTGVNAFLGYASVLFTTIGIENEILFEMVFNFVMLVGVQTGRMFIDAPSGGRRVQLLYATWIMVPSLFIAGGVLQSGVQSIQLIAAVMVCVYAFGFQFAWGMIPWIYPSEIFKQFEREVAMSYAVFWQYSINTLIYFVTPRLMHWSNYGTMYTFGALNMLNLVFVIMCVQETKGVPLEKVPALFGAVEGSFISQRSSGRA